MHQPILDDLDHSSWSLPATASYAWPLKQDPSSPHYDPMPFVNDDDGAVFIHGSFDPSATAAGFLYPPTDGSPFLVDHNNTPSPTFHHEPSPTLISQPLAYHPDPHSPSRPLMLTHRTSLPMSIPSTPYPMRPQSFIIQHSAPAAYSPIARMVHTMPSPTSPDDDDGGRKRRRSPEPMSPDGLGKSPPSKSELHPPKQAPSTWQVFFADWLEDHRARNPRQRLNVAQAAKEAGSVYHNLKPDQRERLKGRALALKEARERELVEWKRKLTPDDIRKENAFRAAQRKAGKSRRGNLKDPNAPKKPLSAYFMFLQYIRANSALVQDVFGDETETTKQSVLAAAKWRQLSDEEKKPFLVQAEQEKIEYETARRLYEDRTNGVATSTTAYRASGDLPGGSTTSVLMTGFVSAGGSLDSYGAIGVGSDVFLGTSPTGDYSSLPLSGIMINTNDQDMMPVVPGLGTGSDDESLSDTN